MAIRRWAMIWLGMPMLSLAALPLAAADLTYERPTDTPLRSAFNSLFGKDQIRKSYALVIGVGDYDAFKKLNAPPQDALRMRNFLVNEAGFDYVRMLTDGNATKEQITHLMDTEFPQRVGSNDRFLFYFSGHGMTRELGASQRGYLLLKKSRPEDWDQMIDMPRVKEWAENLTGARHVLFVLDACFSGLVAVQVKSAVVRPTTIKRLSRPSSYILTAGVDKEESFSVGGASLFTEAFLSVARGQLEPPVDGIVSLQDMIPRIDRYIDAKTEELRERIKMTPQLYKDRIENNEGEFYFVLPQRIPPVKTAVALTTPETRKSGATQSAVTGVNRTSAAQQPPPAAQPPAAGPLSLAGTHLSCEVIDDSAASFGVAATTGTVTIDFDDDKSGRIRVPTVFLPPAHGGRNGVFQLQNVVSTENDITAMYAVNIVNHTKIRLDRLNSTLDIGPWTGKCQVEKGERARLF